MLQPPASCVENPESPLCAIDVARGVTRMLLRHDLVAMGEVPLDGGRRADLMGDGKWTDYLGCCDRFYWAVPAGFNAAPLDGEAFLPARTGVIIADRYDAAIVREAHSEPLAAATRTRATLAFARLAGRRLIGVIDPDAEVVFS